MVKTLPASTGDARDVGLVPGWGRFPGQETPGVTGKFGLGVQNEKQVKG